MKPASGVQWISYSLPLIFIIFSVFLAFSDNSLSVDTAAQVPFELLAGIFLAIYILDPVIRRRSAAMSLHISSFVVVNLIVFSVAFYSFPQFPLMISSLVIYLIYYYTKAKTVPDVAVRIPTFFATIILMAFLGDIIAHILQPPGFPVTVESSATMFTITGLKVPLLEKFGIFVISPQSDFVTSPIEYILFFGIATLVSENYHQIITYLRGSRDFGNRLSMAVYGLTGALSCQCESFIALLPAVSILLIDEILVPMIFVSAGLLAATYLLITRYYSKGISLRVFGAEAWLSIGYVRLALVTIIIVVIPAFFTIGVYYSWQRNALFFFLSNMLMILTGYTVLVSVFRVLTPIRLSRTIVIVLAMAGSALPIIWFMPTLTTSAYNDPGIFGLMTISGFLGGAILGLAYSALDRNDRFVFNEYVTVVFSFLPLIIFYITDTMQKKIWAVFSLTGQTEFSLIGWLVMLPIMWYATHASLNNISGKYSIGGARFAGWVGKEF